MRAVIFPAATAPTSPEPSGAGTPSAPSTESDCWTVTAGQLIPLIAALIAAARRSLRSTATRSAPSRSTSEGRTASCARTAKPPPGSPSRADSPT